MSGYRDLSTFDPYAEPAQGRVMRPFNWVQWTGVALETVGFAGYAWYFAQRAGWLADVRLNTMLFGMPFLFLGQSLILSRREPLADPAPELAAARKRWLLITVAICAAILGVATIFALKGY